jgi:16S rRNA (cytosine1402-N4)-methyltransferase
VELRHLPVLLAEVLEALQCGRPGLYVDCTVGAGGHARGILTSSPENRLIGFDWDQEAIEIASENLKEFGARVTLFREDFSSLRTVLDELKIREVDGFLFDLGLSSMQLASKERGFSFQEDTALDMRMDLRKKITASDLVNKLPERELVKILKVYGEERWARRIVSAILREREKEPVTSTRRLSDIVCSAVPHSYRAGRIHPATRTFQALRIAVNRELDLLDTAIKDAVGYLKTGRRIGVISFHSLEDRIVKEAFRTMERGCTCPPRIPYCVCGFKKSITVLTRKPIRPSASEIINNPRARSAKFRVAERV